MKRIISLFILFYFQLPTANCQLSSYWQQQVNYKIDVTLNDAENTLDGYVKMDYFNNSPDTLRFIWIHLWPNAYKNDKTAFTDQVLENGSTKFYFSNADKRGYINRLDFKVNGNTAKTEDHPQHQDIIKLILPEPLAPKANIKIETPFHVKLPYAFSRGGHIDQAYQITQWYPKPAVYDWKGWHPIPYLDQGEFYAEFGNYEVQITLPGNYIVAATGDLQTESEKLWLKNKKPLTAEPKPKKQILSKKIKGEVVSTSSAKTKTIQFKQNNVHDFAWFADKTFTIKTDTLQLPSGKIINAYAYYYANNAEVWNNSIAMIKRAILTKSKWLGEYPYNVVSVVDGGNGGGMEYPTITILESGGSEKMLDFVINHEVGHNWFEAILATNERTHPWMDEGMNTYYDNRYSLQQASRRGHPLWDQPRVGVHVIGVDVGHHRDHRLQVQEARVRLVGLDHDEFTRTQLGVRAGRDQPPADHESRVEAALGQHARHQAGRGGLAVRAGDGDALLQAQQLGQHQRARHDRDALGARGNHFRVVRAHRGRDHHRVGALDVLALVPEGDAAAHRRQAPGRRVGREIRAAHLVAEVHQHLGDAAHAGAADADEMDAMDLVLHAPRAPASSMQRSATIRAASGLPSKRALPAITASFFLSRSLNNRESDSGVRVDCGSRIAAPLSAR